MGMTHKEWMRRCIEECKTCGNLNTASGAERLIEKFAGHVDETYGQLSEEIAKVNGGGLVKTAIIKGDTYDATMEYFRKMQIDPSTAGDNPIKPTPADSFTCTNMSFEEANDFLLNGGVLNVVVLTMGKCVPGMWVCLDPSGERKITGGISFESNFFSFMWTPDSIKVTSG